MNSDYKVLMDRLGYRFKDESLLENALTHSSYCYEHRLRYRENNERLEFLGDAFLDAIMAEVFYEKLSENEEGDLSKTRAEVVREDSLLRKAEDLGLESFIRMGRGEEQSGSTKKKRSLIADALEAVIGAMYLDGGYDAVKSTIVPLFEDIIEDALMGRLSNDYKTELQELMQARGDSRLVYRIEDEKGPDHDKTFYAVVKIDGVPEGHGEGKSKKEAEQGAAREALKKMRG